MKQTCPKVQDIRVALTCKKSWNKKASLIVWVKDRGSQSNKFKPVDNKKSFFNNHQRIKDKEEKI